VGEKVINNLFLAKPDKKYQKSFEDYVLAYKTTGDEHYFNKYKKGLENFSEYLTDLHNYSNGIDLPEGEIMTSTFWLIDNNEVVGVVRLRHQEDKYSGHIGADISPYQRKKGYGTQMLKLAVEEAAKIGIDEAIVTCNVENIASKTIIEKNNGKFLGSIFDEEENENLYKFSIATSNE